MAKTTHEEILNLFSDKYNGEYSYPNFMNNPLLKGVKTRIEIKCKLHGVFERAISNHLKTGGCRKCHNSKRLSNKQWLSRFKETHNEYYSYPGFLDKILDKGKDTKIEIKCPIHGSWKTSTVHNHSNGTGCPECAGNKRLTKEEIRRKLHKIYKDQFTYPDFDQVDFKGLNTKITVKCKDHKKYITTIEVHMRGNGCKECNILAGRAVTPSQWLNRLKDKFGQKYEFEDFIKKGLPDSGNTIIKSKCGRHGVWKNKIKLLYKSNGCPKCKGIIKDTKEIEGEEFKFCRGCEEYKKLKNFKKQNRCNVCRCDYVKKKYKNNNIFKLKRLIRGLISSSLKSKKAAKTKSTEKILGVSIKEMITKLNNNKWGFKYEHNLYDIDHIIPMSSAKTEEDVYRLNHYTNFQLLPRYYNRHIKRDKDVNDYRLMCWLKETNFYEENF